MPSKESTGAKNITLEVLSKETSSLWLPPDMKQPRSPRRFAGVRDAGISALFAVLILMILILKGSKEFKKASTAVAMPAADNVIVPRSAPLKCVKWVAASFCSPYL